MALKLLDIKKNHDLAFDSNQTIREQAGDDTIFYWVTHHGGDDFANTIEDEYRGEFDLLRKGGRAIQGDLRSNPIQNDFEPRDEDRKDAADLADGLYRSGCNNNTSIEAFDNSMQETVICGYGAWELRSELEVDRKGAEKQVIRRYPIYDANNTAYCDPNARLLDKSDSNFWSILTPYTDAGYIQLVKDLTGEELETVSDTSFSDPDYDFVFNWYGPETKTIYVTTFYHREKIQVNVLTLQSIDGDIRVHDESEVEDHLDALIEEGWEIVEEKEVDRWEVRKYIASGSEILNGERAEEEGEREGEVIPGPNIPVIPRYGEHAYVNGMEIYEGMVRLAKDPVRLHDAAMQYLADIFTTGPGQKPVVTRAQIQGLEEMWNQSGFGDRQPYKVINDKTENGTPVAPVIGMTPDTPVPMAVQAMLGQTRQSVTDVVDPGNPGDIADMDLSGKAVLALQARLDLQSIVYQEHGKHAHRRDGQVWAGMAAVVMDVPSTRSMELPDGTRKTVKMMEYRLNPETLQMEVLNDLSNLEFDVFSKIGASYSSQKEATLDRLDKMAARQVPGSPMARIIELKSMMLVDGVAFDDVRDYARKQLMIMGINEPETPEEEQWLAQEQQKQKEPDAEMVLAQGEMLKGQAAMMGEETKRMTAQTNAQNNQSKLLIEEFKAATARFAEQIDAQQAGATIDKTSAEALGQKIDNRTKMVELRQPKNRSTEELYQILAS